MLMNVLRLLSERIGQALSGPRPARRMALVPVAAARRDPLFQRGDAYRSPRDY